MDANPGLVPNQGQNVYSIKRKFPVTQKSDCGEIRVVYKRYDSCASAVLLYRCRSDSSGKTNRIPQKYSGVW